LLKIAAYIELIIEFKEGLDAAACCVASPAYCVFSFRPVAYLCILKVTDVPPPPVSKELKKRWSYFIRKAYETDPLVCSKCSGEMRIISFIEQRDVIRKILEKLGLWEEAHAPLGRGPPEKEITFDPSYGSINSPSRGRSRDSQLI
jgi:hypothetical protein